MVFSIGKYIFSIFLGKFIFLKYLLIPDYDNKYKEHVWTDGNFTFYYSAQYIDFEFALIKCKAHLYECLLEDKLKLKNGKTRL